MILVQRVGRKLVDNTVEALLGDAKFLRHNLVAQAYRLVKKALQIGHHYQSAGQGIFGIKQTDVYLLVRQAEVVAQNTVVEQQLHVMVFFLKAAILVGLVALYVVVGTRFLFHQQPKVARHEVNAPL